MKNTPSLRSRRLASVLSLLAVACSGGPELEVRDLASKPSPVASVAETLEPETKSAENAMTEESLATFGAGCFWCVEAVFEQLDGVLDVSSGYMGGPSDHVTYKEVCTGKTGHAEVIQVRFDPARVSFDKLLQTFFESHDPTTLNRQGNDHGTQYRSAIFFHSEEQEKAAKAAIKRFAPAFKQPIVTEVTAASKYIQAEGYHQDYYRLNKEQPYCQAVIRPKLDKLGLEY